MKHVLLLVNDNFSVFSISARRERERCPSQHPKSRPPSTPTSTPKHLLAVRMLETLLLVTSRAFPAVSRPGLQSKPCHISGLSNDTWFLLLSICLFCGFFTLFWFLLGLRLLCHGGHGLWLRLVEVVGSGYHHLLVHTTTRHVRHL